MRPKHTQAFLAAVLVLLASHIYAANDLRLWLFSNNSSVRLDPGQEVTYEYLYGYGDPVDVRLFHPLPPGATLVRSSDPRWNCARNTDGVLCTRRLESDPNPPQTHVLRLTIAAPDDPAGLSFGGTARIESDQPDPRPDDNTQAIGMSVFHILTVTTPEDFGAGSLRDRIEHANAECDGRIPCKILFADAMRIAPGSPLPRITACDVLIDAGGYRGDTRNRSFDAPRRVELSGENVSSGSGLVIASKCERGGGYRLGPTIQGLAIHSFPENGVSVEDPAQPDASIIGCSIGTDAAGTVALPNGLRGVSVVAPKASVVIASSLIAGNARSGVSFFSAASGQLSGNLIGVRFGGIPMPNGASGVYVNGGEVSSYANAIEYNHEFGVAVGPGAKHFMSQNDYIGLNGGLPIDWGLDGPTATDGSGHMPPVPHLLDAFYDPARDRTVIKGVIPIDSTTAPGLFEVWPSFADGDFQGGVAAGTGTSLLARRGGADIPFEASVAGNLTGRTITARTVRQIDPEYFPIDSSEFSAAITVR